MSLLYIYSPKANTTGGCWYSVRLQYGRWTHAHTIWNAAERHGKDGEWKSERAREREYFGDTYIHTDNEISKWILVSGRRCGSDSLENEPIFDFHLRSFYWLNNVHSGHFFVAPPALHRPAPRPPPDQRIIWPIIYIYDRPVERVTRWPCLRRPKRERERANTSTIPPMGENQYIGSIRENGICIDSTRSGIIIQIVYITIW